MKRISLSLLVVCLILFSFTTVNAQKIDDHLTTLIQGTYGRAYLKGYVQPFSTALGTALGGAMFHRAYTKTFPRFDIGVNTVFIPLPDEAKTFTSPYAMLQGNVPTVFGSKSPSITGAIPGFDQDYFLLPVLQANVGLVGNLEATARFATTDIDYLGKLTVYGGALKYGLSDLIPIPMFPLDFSIQAGYHKFTLGDILDAGTFSMNFQTSYSIPLLPIDIYGGLGYDNSSLTVKSAALVPTSDMGDVKVSGENQMRFNAGISFTLLFFNAHVDYNLGKYNSIAGGLMFVL